MAFVYLNQQKISISNIFCIGRNYAAHIAELNHQQDEEVPIFLKPTSALLHNKEMIVLPDFSDNIHYECELVVLIGKDGANIKAEDAEQYIQGYGIGLDLTARDVQDIARKKGLPWLKCKGFKHAACVSDFIAASEISDIQASEFTLTINKQIRQHGYCKNMISPVAQLIALLSKYFGLTAGDLIFTGTPEGVGKLNHGDLLQLNFNQQVSAEFIVE